MKRTLGKFKVVATVLLLFCVITNSIPAYAGNLNTGFSEPNLNVAADIINVSGNNDEAGVNAAVPDPIGPTHKYVIKTVASTCTVKGYEEKKCSLYSTCSTHPYKKTILPLDANAHTEIVNYVSATCTTRRLKNTSCKECKNLLKSEVVGGIDPNNHPKTRSNTTSANCTEPQTTRTVCTSCNKELSSSTYGFALGHAHTIILQRVEPTTVRDGYEIRKCSRSGCSDTIQLVLNRITPNNAENLDKSIPDEKNENNTEEVKKVDPVNVYTGAHEIDIELLSLGGANNISVGLKYKSSKTIAGIFGNGFYWNYESFAKEKDGDVLVYHSPAEYVTYKKDTTKGSNAYTTSTLGNETDILTKESDGTYTLVSHGKTFTFNNKGKLSSVVSKTGKKVEITYESSLIKLIDKVSGQTISLMLNEKGLVNKVAGGSSYATIEYNEAGFISRVVDVDGYETLYTYDELGQVLTATDADGNVYFKDEYDVYGRVVAQSDATNNKSYFEYVNNADETRTVTLTDREGNKKVYTFDSVGRKLKEVNEEGNETSYTYDEKGNLIKVVDALNNEIKREYDARNNLVKEINPLGKETKYTYDSKDNLLEITYPNGSKNTFKYDEKNQLISSIDRRGLETVNDYDVNGYLIRTGTKKADGASETINIYHVHSGSETEGLGCYGKENQSTRLSCTLPEHVHNDGCYRYVISGYEYKKCNSCGFENPSYASSCRCGSTSLTYGDCRNWGRSSAPRCSGGHTHSTGCYTTYVSSYSLDCGKTTSTVEGTISALGGKTSKITAAGKVTLKGYSWTTTDGKIESGATSSTCKTSKPGTYNCKVTYENLVTNKNETVNLTVTTYDFNYSDEPFEARENLYIYENGNLKSLTDTKGNVTTFKYDTNDHLVETITPDGAKTTSMVSAYGSMLSVTDALGYETKATYTSMAKPKTTKDSEGNVITCIYDERQLLSQIIDAKGVVTTYNYDAEERLKRVTSCDGSYKENFYDKAGRLVKSVDNEGDETSYTLDALGRIKENITPDGGKITYTYTKKGQIETKTDENGNTYSYTYGSVGELLTITNPYGGVTKHTYNQAGDLISIEDPLGNKITYTYDIYGKKISETDPNGNKTTYAYDVNGNLTSITNALGETIYYSYDSCNRLISKKSDVDGEYEIIDLFINEAGQWEAIVDYPKAKLSYEYDKKGQLIAVIDALGNKTESFYDKRGNVSKVTDALGNETTYKYDENNTLIETVNAKGKSTAYKINSLNQVAAVTDALGLKYTYEYNKNGQKIKSTNPLGGESKNIYDKEGNIIELIGPEGGTTELTYDLKGNLATRSTIEGEKVTYTYNALDLVETYENARGQSITYEYDLAGRIIKATAPEGMTSYTYDSNGNVLTVTDGEGTVTRTYDALNRVTSVTDQRGNKVSYKYDKTGNLTELTYPDNTKVTYTYDLNHNLISVTDWTNKTTSYSYDAINRETETLHPDGRKTGKTYDALGNLITLTEYNKTGDVIDKTTYIYDDINRLVVEKYETRSYQYEYIYDDLSRVSSRVTRNTENLEVIETETFNYDGAGNITEAKTADSSKDLSYISKDNRLAAVNKNAYSFDKDGNMIKGTLDGKSVTLTYDSKNHLTKYDFDTYRYDSEDYRLSSTVKMPVSGQNTAATSKAMLSESQDISVNLSETDATIDESQSDSVNTEGTKSQDDEETSDDEDPDPQEKEIKAEIGTLFEDGSSTVDESQSEVFIDDIETETEESKIPSDGESTAVVTATESISESLADKLIGGEVSELILEDADVLNATSTVTIVTNNFVYDRENKNLLVRYTSAGVTEKYIYGNGLIASYETKTNTTEYKNYTYDLRGSVTKVFNEAGTLTSEYTYSTYGNRSTVMGDANSPIGYCGREGVLTETNGLIYMRARYYSAELMRFVNEDIVLGDISSSNSLNRYTYVEGNPATMIDPFGLCGRNVIKNNDLYDTSIKYRATYDNIIMIEGYTEIVTDDMLKRIINAFELNKNYYEQISYETDMPLELIAAIHYRENAPDYLNSNCNVYLQNGQILGSETTNVPKGLLYYDFVEAGIMAFKNDDQKWKQTVMKVSKECDDITAMVTYSILYNGWQDGISAYAYNGTNLYEKGLFTSDGIYSPEAVDKNLGTFVVINELYNYRRNK